MDAGQIAVQMVEETDYGPEIRTKALCEHLAVLETRLEAVERWVRLYEEAVEETLQQGRE